MDDLYNSQEWIKATPKQRQEFISKLRADKRMEQDKLKEERRLKKIADRTPAPAKKKSKKQKRKERIFQRQIRQADRSKFVRTVRVNDIDVITNDFLSTPEWRDLRLLAIQKYGSTCLSCGREGTKRFPINIDHVKPRKYFPELALDINNLQPLCGKCNKRKGNKTIDYRI